nr:MFS transporter [uncultured Methanoregula sp.]
MPRLPESTAQRIIITVVVLGSFIGAVDSGIVVISLTAISRFYAVGTSPASWVLISYLLVLTGLLIPFGRLADVKGPKNIFVAGFVLFTASSFLCGIAASLPELILFRALQGIGGAMITAMGPALITNFIPAHGVGRAFGYLTAANGLGLAAGFGLGGIITYFFSWQWIFFINIPIGIIAIITAVLFIPCRDVRKESVVVTGTFNLRGSLLIMTGAGLFIFTLSLGQELGWTSPAILAAFFLSILFTVLFVISERRSATPLLHLDLLKSRGISLGIGAAMSNRLVVSGMIYLIPLYLEIVTGYTTGFVGFLLLAPSLLILVAGPAAGLISDRIGSRWLCTLSGFLLLASIIFFIIFDDSSPLIFIIIALCLRTISMGLFAPPNLHLVFSCAPREHQGAVSGLWYFSRYLASTIGIVLFETLFELWIHVDEPDGLRVSILQHHSIMELKTGFDMVFLVGMVIVFVMIVLSVLFRENMTRGDHEKVRTGIPNNNT